VGSEIGPRVSLNLLPSDFIVPILSLHLLLLLSAGAVFRLFSILT